MDYDIAIYSIIAWDYDMILYYDLWLNFDILYNPLAFVATYFNTNSDVPKAQVGYVHRLVIECDSYCS